MYDLESPVSQVSICRGEEEGERQRKRGRGVGKHSFSNGVLDSHSQQVKFFRRSHVYIDWVEIFKRYSTKTTNK